MIKRFLRKLFDIPGHLVNALKFTLQGVEIKGKIHLSGKINVVNRGEIEIGPSSRIIGSDKMNPIGFGDTVNLIAEKGARISIGEDTGLSNATIYARESIHIGSHTLIGGGVKIYDTDFHALNYEFRGASLLDKQNTKNRQIVIGDNVFIGAGAIILKGVNIGDRAIIGAGSVVTHNIGADEIWAGNPAVFIRKNA